jgi:DNA-directed RNA polymerase specialized sigma24 family protein
VLLCRGRVRGHGEHGDDGEEKADHMDLQGDAGATQRSRAGGEVITPPLEAVWPEAERRLRALLYRRGLDRSTADDVVQEVALRVLAGNVTYDSAKDLLRWAGPVACNLHVDLLRQRARLHDGEVDAEHPAAHDVAREVADRMELQRAFRGLARLRPADRQAIIDAVTEDAAPGRTRKEAVRLAVRRHRARNRLALVLETLAANVLGWRWLRRTGLAGGAVAVVPLVTLPLLLVLPPRPAPSPRPHEVTAPAPAAVVRLREGRAAPARAAGRAAAPRVDARGGPRAEVEVGAEQRKAAPIVDVETPNGVKAKVRGDERQPDDYLICARDVPYLPTICV